MFSIESAREKEALLLDKWSELLTNKESITTKSRYKHIQTMDVANFFRSKGWVIRTVQGAGKFSRHLVRMVHGDHKIGEDQLEILIRNSYDGRSKLNVSLGVYRLVCSNGLVVGETFYSIVQKHIGQNIEQELENKYEKLVAQSELLSSAVKKMKETTIDVPLRLVEKIAVETIGERNSVYSVDTEKLLKPLRDEDTGKDLWSIMNVVQEKVINGGIEFKVQEEVEGENVVSLKRTKKRSNIFNNLRLNKMIFDEFLSLAA